MSHVYLVPWPKDAYVGTQEYGLGQNYHCIKIHIPIFCRNWGIQWKNEYRNCFYYRYNNDEEFQRLTLDFIALNDIVFREEVHDRHSDRIQVWTAIPPGEE